MLEKRDVIYYTRLAYTQGALGAAILSLCFVTGVAAKYHMTEVHLFAPYWVGIPLILQALATYLAARIHKRWPLAIWFPLFFVFLAAASAFIITMPVYKANLYNRYPCFVQSNDKYDKSRCICAYDNTQFLEVDGASDVTPCIRVFNVMFLMGNVNFMLIVLSLIPELLMFILVCNDLCCVSCRRSALVPQIIVTSGGSHPGSMLPVHSQTVTYRTDEEPAGGSRSTGQNIKMCKLN